MIHGERIRSDPTGRIVFCSTLTQDCAALVLGYFQWLPTGADQSAADGMTDVACIQSIFSVGVENGVDREVHATAGREAGATFLSIHIQAVTVLEGSVLSFRPLGNL